MSYTGVLLVDKPQGPSSHQVAAWVGSMLKSSVGHSGTLDPMVSGVLVVMLGKAVRLAPLLLLHEKEYVACLRLHADVPRDRVEEAVKQFTGRIYQRPPRRSAVKPAFGGEAGTAHPGNSPNRAFGYAGSAGPDPGSL